MAQVTHKLLTLVTLAMLAAAGTRAGDAADNTDLVMTFLVHRHGDRTPMESTLSMSTDSDALDALSTPYGYGQLTDKGKQTAYSLGQTLRARYGEFIPAQYNRSEVYIRATDSTRTKMTVLTAMAAVFAAGEDNWSDVLPWTPTPYTTVPVRYDPNLAMLNCPTFIQFYYSKMYETSSRFDPYFDVLNTWSSYVSFNLTQLPVLTYSVYDVYTSQMSLGLDLGEELDALFPVLKEIAGIAIDVVFGDDEYVPFQAGVLLKEFFEQADAAASGTGTPVRILSAHDYNVYSFMATVGVAERQGVPYYGSAFALELRRARGSDDLYVLPVYFSEPGTAPLYLEIEGCSALLCPLGEFSDITADRVMDEDTWREQCGYTDDLVVDDSGIA